MSGYSSRVSSRFFKRMRLVPAAALVLALTVWGGEPAKAGYLVVNNDEWTFSNTGFAQSPTASVFINNITNLFTGDQPGNFLAYSQNFGLNEASLANAVTGAGHTWTVSTAGPFTAAALSAYDGVFLAGSLGPTYPDQQVLIDYVQNGGNVYIGAGTGNLGPVAEAAAWNQLLALAGLQFESVYNGITGNAVPVGPHPLLAGVSSLYFANGSSVLDIAPADDTGEILFSLNGAGMLALGHFGDLPPPSEFTPPSAIPAPGGIALLALGLAGFVLIRRRSVL